MGPTHPHGAILRICKTLARHSRRQTRRSFDGQPESTESASFCEPRPRRAASACSVCCIADTLWSVERSVRSGGGGGGCREHKAGEEGFRGLCQTMNVGGKKKKDL